MKNLTCRILESAEADLRTVVRSLAGAQPEQLESAQRLLERMVGTLGEIEAAARRNTLPPIAVPLRQLRTKLHSAGTLSAIALATIDKQAQLAGLAPGGPESSFYVEG